ncbi:MAG: hypothetical protein MUC48_24305 [Leptolyngbya sp. Prado105]|jgi:hypothetical protein|nr:hypothetical protein [Leptolyngbya sp. Prado105]
MAFKDSWQQQRQARLQQVAQRRQAVSTLLQATHEQRQTNASQLRSDLSLFRETLAYDTSLRRDNLRQFCETLQDQTQEFLAIAQAERSLMSQQLSHDLSAFRSTLEKTVESLRQEIQADLQILQISTQAQLDESHQRRVQNRICLARDLQIFVDELRLSVVTFLADATLERQEKAAQNQRDRKAKLEELFNEFAEFRSQLKQYRSTLSQTVWGEEIQHSQSAEPRVSKSTTEPVAAEKPPAAKSAVNPVAAAESPAPKPAAKPVIVKPRGFRVAASTASNPSPTMPVTADPALSSEEKRIYDYIEDMQSVRLTEIESALGMTRIQAVEGLRSLIQQGKITQKDRVYLISK